MKLSPAERSNLRHTAEKSPFKARRQNATIIVDRHYRRLKRRQGFGSLIKIILSIFKQTREVPGANLNNYGRRTIVR